MTKIIDEGIVVFHNTHDAIKADNICDTEKIYSELDDEEIIKFCEKTLKYCYIYNTVKKSINMDIKFVPII